MDNIEAWLRGPIEGVPSLLQPVAHALTQANAEIHAMMKDFPESKLWDQPAGAASAAFHLQHIPGVLDRLFSYSQGLPISNAQLKYLSEEGLENQDTTKSMLLERLSEQITSAINHLKTIDAAGLTAERTVGRKKLPSTVIGLLFHAAEHTMRHTGQLLVTVKVLSAAEA
jgi:uncharacterized damage-inducible protein DinB